MHFSFSNAQQVKVFGENLEPLHNAFIVVKELLTLSLRKLICGASGPRS